MVVYRYLSQRELDAFLRGDLDSVGAEYYESEKSVSNTHAYKEGVRYLHFFQSLKDLRYIEKVRTQNKEHFIAQFNIPIMTLIHYAGKGYYPPRGYDCDYEIIREYAIPVDSIRPSFLEGYVSSREFSASNAHDYSNDVNRVFDMEKQPVDFSLIDVVQDQ